MAAPSNFQRVLTYLQKSSQSTPILADFSQSIVDYYVTNGDICSVYPRLENKKLILFPPEPKKSVKIKRPSFCPFHNLTSTLASQLSNDVKQRGVDIGVCVLLESHDGLVLLTRRSDHMRTFPRVWVTPGGHIENNETLHEACFRELKEETGLTVTSDMCQGSEVNILALWESTFPTKLSRGLPKRHHVVIYLLAQLDNPYTSEYLNKHIVLDPQEVSACAWINNDLVKDIVEQGNEEMKDIGKGHLDHYQQKTFRAITTNIDGTISQEDISTKRLTTTCPEESKDIERVSTGSKYALQEWLTVKECNT